MRFNTYTLFKHLFKMISNIIHLSDIHIRAGNQDKSRFKEYLSTFDSLFKSISHLPSVKTKNAIVVITGDLFHHKNKLEPYGLELALHLLTGLSSIAPVYLIRGNHDYRQDIPDEHDMITALMAYNIKNVTYLDKTGTYYHENIGFGLVAIQDTLLYGSTSGISSTLPPFPVPNQAEFSIALFHGSITGSTLQTNVATLHGYPIDWFQGFDAILLGDIHLQQVNRAKKIDYTFPTIPHTMHVNTFAYEDTVPWGYPGSLIQQDFGEQLIGHGYIVWDLKEKLIHAMHVYNSFGFLKIRDNNILSPYTFDQLLPMIPTHVKITTTGVCEEILTTLLEHGKNIIFIKTSEQKQLYEEEKKEQKDILQINSIDVLIEYIQNVITDDNKSFPCNWQSWLKNPEQLIISTANFPEQLAKKVSERSDKIHKAAAKYKEDFEKFVSQQSVKGLFHIHSLQWNWILNYKDGNSYDFDKSMSQISIINAKNGCGKSNFLEIICIALFGEGFPSRENQNYSAGIICDKKPEGFSPTTTIVFSINDVKYRLHRVMRHNTISRLICYDKIVLSVLGEHEQILHQQKGAVHPWIENNIGNIETYLMTAMLSQNADRDFYTLDKPTQKALLDRIMSLDHINSLKVFLKETDKYYKYVCDLIETYHAGIIGSRDPMLLQQLEDTKIQIELSNTICNSLRSQWNHIPEQKLSQLDIEFAKTQYAEWTTIDNTQSLQEMTGQLSEIEKNIAEFSHKLQEYKSFPDSDITETTLTLQKLPKNIIHISYLYSVLEEHPFFKTHELYESHTCILEHIDDTFENDDCSQELFQANRDFETWQSIKLAEFREFSDIDDSIINAELSTYSTITEEYPKRITQNIKRMKLIRKKLLMKRKEKEEHLEKRPNKPSKDLEWLQSIEQRLRNSSIDELVDIEEFLSESIQSVPILSSAILALDRRINDMERYVGDCEDIPFNSKCKACRVQPWKKTHDEYLAELPLLRNEVAEKNSGLLDKLYADIPFDITDYTTYIHSAEELLFSTKEKIALHQLYIVEEKLYTEYDDWTTSYEMICMEHDTMEHECDRLETVIKEDETVLTHATGEKHKIETRMTQINLKKKEYELYLAELTTRQETADLNTGKLNYNWYSALQEYNTYVAHLVIFLKKHIQTLVLERDSIQQIVKQCIARDEQLGKATELLCIIEAYPLWKEWKVEVEKQQDALLLSRELETKQGGKVGNGIDLDALKNTVEIVSYLSDKFDGYREWLYKSHIGPMIQEHVNAVLHMICQERPLHLETEWLDKINTLSWFVRDGASRPVIEKASGFQRFIVGMATRVAFHQIGFCRIQFNQLFIDEGFTSCDSDNLEKVPEFLQGLLKLYNSIYLATHLEELKVCSHTQICITRDANGLSQIAYGAVSEMVEPPKKKGRPVKNKINVTKESL